MATSADRITVVKVGIRGLNGTGVTAAQWAALQAIVASATTGKLTVTITDTAAVQVRKADNTVIANINTNGSLVSVWNGASFAGFSDAGSTEKFRIVGSNGHIFTSGSAPGAAVAAGGAAGSGASLGAVSGDDTAGKVTLTTGGSGTAAGALIDVTFASSYGSAPSAISVFALSAGGGGLGLYATSISATGFTIACKTAPATSTACTFSWIVIG